MEGLAWLRRVLEENNLAEWNTSGIRDLLTDNTERALFDEVAEFVQTYNQLPSWDTFRQAHRTPLPDGMAWPEVTEPAPFFRDRLRRSRIQRQIHDHIRAVVRCLEAGDHDGARAAILDAAQHLDAHEPTRPMATVCAVDLLAEAPGDTIDWFPFFSQPGVLGRGIATLISAHGKAGKSTTLFHAIRQLLRDRPSTRVLWLTEEPRQLWRTRLRAHPEAASPEFRLVFADGMAWADHLRALDHYEADVVVIDTLRAFAAIEDENAAADVSNALLPLVHLTRRKLWSLVLVHHLRKQVTSGDHGLSHAGSHALVGLVDIAVQMQRDSQQATRRKWLAISRLDATPDSWLTELRNGEVVYLGDPSQFVFEGIVERVFEVLTNTWQSVSEIQQRVEPPVSTQSVRRALDELTQHTRAERSGEGSRGRPYQWRRIA